MNSAPGLSQDGHPAAGSCVVAGDRVGSEVPAASTIVSHAVQCLFKGPTSAQRRGCRPLSRSPCWPLHHPEGRVTPDDLAHSCHKISRSERWATCASKNPAGRPAALPGWFAPTVRCLRPPTHGSSWGLQRTTDAGDGGVAPSRPAGDAASIQVTVPTPTRRGGSTSRPMISSWQSPPSRDALLPGGVTSRLCR